MKNDIIMGMIIIATLFFAAFFVREQTIREYGRELLNNITQRVSARLIERLAATIIASIALIGFGWASHYAISANVWSDWSAPDTVFLSGMPTYTAGVDSAIVMEDFSGYADTTYYNDDGGTTMGPWTVNPGASYSANLADTVSNEISITQTDPPPGNTKSVKWRLHLSMDTSAIGQFVDKYSQIIGAFTPPAWTTSPKRYVLSYWFKFSADFDFRSNLKVVSVQMPNGKYVRLPETQPAYSCPGDELQGATGYTTKQRPAIYFQNQVSPASAQPNGTVTDCGNGTAIYGQNQEPSLVVDSILDAQWYKWTIVVREESSVDAGDGFVQIWITDEASINTEIMCFDGSDNSRVEYQKTWTRTYTPTGTINVGPHPMNRGYPVDPYEEMSIGDVRWWQETNDVFVCGVGS